MTFILNIWKIVNVKTPFKGKPKSCTCPILHVNVYLLIIHFILSPNLLQFLYISGEHKRDDFSFPIQSVDDFKLVYLRTGITILTEWQSSKRDGLSSPTFTACIQTFRALIDLSIYLLERHGFLCVLLGKFQSDPLEGRFGHYRQLSGGNFYISCRQLLQAEKKIRLLKEMEVSILVFRILHFVFTFRLYVQLTVWEMANVII